MLKIDKTTMEIDFDPETATVAEWRKGYALVTKEMRRHFEFFMLLADVYQFPADAVLMEEAEKVRQKLEPKPAIVWH